MIPDNNPAGRLHIILSKAKAQGDQPLRGLWSSVFGVEQHDIITIVRRLVAMHETLAEVKCLIDSAPESHRESFHRAMPGIEHALNISNLDSSWSVYKGSLSDEVMTRLEFCSLYLAEVASELPIAPEELKALREEVDALFDLVNESDIDEELKVEILQSLDDVRSAIAEYQIKGARPIKQAVEKAVGSIVINGGKNVKKPVIDRVVEFLGKAHTIATRVLKIKRAIEGIVPMGKLLSWLGGGGDSPGGE